MITVKNVKFPDVEDALKTPFMETKSKEMIRSAWNGKVKDYAERLSIYKWFGTRDYTMALINFSPIVIASKYDQGKDILQNASKSSLEQICKYIGAGDGKNLKTYLETNPQAQWYKDIFYDVLGYCEGVGGKQKETVWNNFLNQVKKMKAWVINKKYVETKLCGVVKDAFGDAPAKTMRKSLEKSLGSDPGSSTGGQGKIHTGSDSKQELKPKTPPVQPQAQPQPPQQLGSSSSATSVPVVSSPQPRPKPEPKPGPSSSGAYVTASSSSGSTPKFQLSSPQESESETANPPASDGSSLQPQLQPKPQPQPLSPLQPETPRVQPQPQFPQQPGPSSSGASVPADSSPQHTPPSQPLKQEPPQQPRPQPQPQPQPQPKPEPDPKTTPVYIRTRKRVSDLQSVVLRRPVAASSPGAMSAVNLPIEDPKPKIQLMENPLSGHKNAEFYYESKKLRKSKTFDGVVCFYGQKDFFSTLSRNDMRYTIKLIPGTLCDVNDWLGYTMTDEYQTFIVVNENGKNVCVVDPQKRPEKFNIYNRAATDKPTVYLPQIFVGTWESMTPFSTRHENMKNWARDEIGKHEPFFEWLEKRKEQEEEEKDRYYPLVPKDTYNEITRKVWNKRLNEKPIVLQYENDPKKYLAPDFRLPNYDDRTIFSYYSKENYSNEILGVLQQDLEKIISKSTEPKTDSTLLGLCRCEPEKLTDLSKHGVMDPDYYIPILSKCLKDIKISLNPPKLPNVHGPARTAKCSKDSAADYQINTSYLDALVDEMRTLRANAAAKSEESYYDKMDTLEGQLKDMYETQTDPVTGMNIDRMKQKYIAMVRDVPEPIVESVKDMALLAEGPKKIDEPYGFKAVEGGQYKTEHRTWNGKVVVYLDGDKIISEYNTKYLPELTSNGWKFFHIVQVASQMNGLESMSAEYAPLYGQKGDKTQGPTACSQSLMAWIKRDAMYHQGKLPDTAADLVDYLFSEGVIEIPINTEHDGTAVARQRCYVPAPEYLSNPSYKNTPFYQNGYMQPFVLNEKGLEKLQEAVESHPCSYMSQSAVTDKGDQSFTYAFSAAMSYQALRASPRDKLSIELNTSWLRTQYEGIIKDAIRASHAMRDQKVLILVHLTGVGQGAFYNPPGIPDKVLGELVEKYKGQLMGSNIRIIAHWR